MLASWVAPRSLPGLMAGDWMPLESRGTIWSVCQRNWSVMCVTPGKRSRACIFHKVFERGSGRLQAHLRVSTFIDLLVLVLITVKAMGELGLQGGARYLRVLESRLLLQLRHPPLQSPQRAQRLSRLKAGAFQLQVIQNNSSSQQEAGTLRWAYRGRPRAVQGSAPRRTRPALSLESKLPRTHISLLQAPIFSAIKQGVPGIILCPRPGPIRSSHGVGPLPCTVFLLIH